MNWQTLTSVRAQYRLRREEDGTGHERKSGPHAKFSFGAHQSVMVKEAISLLDLKKGEVVVDATAGVGGHSEAILKAARVQLLSIDADKKAVEASTKRLAHYKSRVKVIQGNFRDLDAILRRENIDLVDKFLFDLGWNREQLEAGKGFSFLLDEPLNMSYGEKPASGFTAAEILNSWKEKVIADVLYGYGEERFARPIAKAIVARREILPYTTTIELVETIRDAVPARTRHGKIHVATRTFQALRIAVNDELGSIEKGLKSAWAHLKPGGRIVVITFHSIEDRLVKKTFAAFAKKGGTLLVKKPLTASRAEITHNSSARSAKMRAIEKE